MRILLTGGTGFIGGRLLRRLADAGHEVVATARRPVPADLEPLATWVEQDLANAPDADLLPRSVDAVAHLAQSAHYREFPDGATDVFAVNTHSSFHLLEYARRSGARSFLFTSTGGVYGYSFETLVESAPVDPLNFYLSSKYAAELLIANYQPFFATIVLRPFFVYGPGQQGMLLANLVEKVCAGEEIVIEGTPGLRINPIYVDDAVRVIERALYDERAGLFNVAGNQEVTLRELVDLIAAVAGREAAVRHTSQRPGGDLIGDNTQMREALGVRPRTSLEEGIARVLAWRAAVRQPT